MAERDQPDRYRCTVTGCNPVMHGAEAAAAHAAETSHRTAKWPIRSDEGKAKARARNRNGYYTKYNTGYKSPAARSLHVREDDHPFSSDALGQN